MSAVRIRVEVDDGSPAERVLAEWLRTWRRRGVRRSGKIRSLHQGAEKAMVLVGSLEAIGDLEQRLHGVPSSRVTRELGGSSESGR